MMCSENVIIHVAVDTRHTGNDSQKEEEYKQRIFKVGTEGTSEQITLAFSLVPEIYIEVF